MPAFEDLIYPRQRAFVPGRDMMGHVERLADSFYMDYNSGLRVTYVFLDLEKAYDSVSRDSLFQVLHRMGFADEVVTVLKNQHAASGY